MKKMIEPLFSLRLAQFLMAWTVASASVGFLLIDGRKTTFMALENETLQEWATTYGLNAFGYTWWLFAFIGGVMAMGLNTACCTLKRLIPLLRHLKASRGIFLKFSIHGMHLAFLVILVGYGMSYTMSTIYRGIVLTPGKTWTTPDSRLKIKLIHLKKILYSGPLKPMTGRVMDVEATLALEDKPHGAMRILHLNDAMYVHGNIITIKNFSRLKGKKWIMLYIRKDPGTPIYLIGSVFLAISASFYGIFTLWTKGQEVEPR